MNTSQTLHKTYFRLLVCLFVPLITSHWTKLTTAHFRWDGHQRSSQRLRETRWSFHVAINSADPCELTLLKNIGPVLAGQIVKTREQLPGRRYQTVEQLLLVKGLGPKTLEKIRKYIICD